MLSLNGIIISIKYFKEKDLIVKILAENGKIYSGFVKSGRSPKKSPIFQVGNEVLFAWVGREQSLGSITAEVVKCHSMLLLQNKIALLSMTSICEIVNLFFHGSDQVGLEMHGNLVSFIKTLGSANSEDDILNRYLLVEAMIFLHSGYYDKNSPDITNYEFLVRMSTMYDKRIPTVRILLENNITASML